MKTKLAIRNILVSGVILALAAGCASTPNIIPVTGSEKIPAAEQNTPVVENVEQGQAASDENTAEADTSQQVEPSPMPAAVEHIHVPSTAEGKPQVIHDQISQATAAQKQANGGDEFPRNRFERPFDQEMGYLPYLDIVEADLVRNEDFFYFTIQTVESVSQSPEPPMTGIELDLNLDGRGDYLLLARGPYTPEWGQDGVEVWQDTDDSVGSVTPVLNDNPTGSGNGYDTKIFEAGLGDDPDVAWVRLNPDDNTKIEFALLSTALFPKGQIFLWGAFTDGLIKDPGAFDYNDRFSREEAGSAWKADKDYPVKSLYAVDSTCRAPSGYESRGGEPGVCYIAPPPVEEKGAPPAPSAPSTKPPILT